MHADQIDLARWVLTVAEVGLLVVAVRVGLALVLAAASRSLPRAGTAARWCERTALRVGPVATRALVASVAGASLLVVGPAGPAAAETAGAAIDVPVLDRVVTSGAPTSGSGTPAVRVQPGDTLWGIAARALGPTASSAQVARSWPHWYRSNRDVVGDDPDHLLPGQRLRAPGRH